MPEGSWFTLPQAGHCLSSVWISLPSFIAQSLAVHTPFPELRETPFGGGGEGLPGSG